MGAPPTPLTPGQPAPLAPGEFAGASQPQVVSFLLKNVTPPSPLYVQRDDFLACTMLSRNTNENVTVTARLLLAAEGRITTIQFVVNAPTAFTITSLQIPLAEGYLLSVVAVASNANFPGQTFATLFINRGKSVSLAGQPGQVLGAGYCSQLVPVAWPGGGIQRTTDGAGNPQIFVVANPAAGADWSTGPSANSVWQLVSINAQLVTSAVVANRNVQLDIALSGTLVFRGQALASIVAGTTAQVSAAPLQATSSLIAADVEIPFPPNTLLISTQTIGTTTVNLQVADQWSNIRVYVREWVTF